MTLRDEVRQLIVVGFSGTTASTHVIAHLQPGGGLIYFSGNLHSRTQIRAMSRAAQRTARRTGEPLLLMTDQEGGIVTRIPGTSGTPGGADFAGNALAAEAAPRPVPSCAGAALVLNSGTSYGVLMGRRSGTTSA